MALSVKVSLEAYPEGIPLGIVGLGVVNNGDTMEVDPAMEPVFYAVHGDTVENVMAEQEEMQVTGSADFVPPEPVEETETTSPPASTPPPTPVESGLPSGTAPESTPDEGGV